MVDPTIILHHQFNDVKFGIFQKQINLVKIYVFLLLTVFVQYNIILDFYQCQSFEIYNMVVEKVCM